MNALLSFQEELSRGMPVQECELSQDYKLVFDQPNGRERFSYAKIQNGVVQALSQFALTDPIVGVVNFNLGYAVSEKYRGLGLGVESVLKGLAELKNGFGRAGIKEFYIEAVVGLDNTPSIKVAEDIFGYNCNQITDHYSGELAWHYTKLIKI